MPRLETTSGWSRFRDDITSLFSPTTGNLSARLGILKTLLLRSVRLSLLPTSPTSPLLPLRIRPAFVLLNILILLLLGILGFHPRGQLLIRLNDKLLHFIGFFLATSMFYMIWDVDEPARASYLWRNASLILTSVTCFLVGGIGSEIVQSLLPYKVFQWGDIAANLLGGALGLWFSYQLEKRYRARRELERLYAPLDIEEYGDLAEEGDEEELQTVAAPGIKSSLKQSNSTAAGTGKKKARFNDNDIWDDSVDIQAMPSSSRVEASEGAGKVRKEDLFSIDDEDDDDEEAPKAGKAAASDEGNVWRREDS